MSGSSSKGADTRLISQLLLEDEDLRDVVEEFVAALPERIDALKRASETLDWETLATLAHQLKGASGSYGYPDLSALSAAMEQDFRRHEMEGLPAQLQQLETLIAAARRGLAE